MPLQHDYRPATLEEFFGNESVIEALSLQLARPKDKRPFAYLIVGPSGAGKTTLAYIIRDMLGCGKLDFYEIDASTDRGIGEIRKVKEGLGYAPNKPGGMKIVFFDEVHGITGPAQEAMLKMLEKPPDNVAIIMATTEPEKLKTTTKRRPHIITLAPLMLDDIKELMNGILEAEGFEEYPKEVVDKIASISSGSAGIALKILDSIIDLEDLATILDAIEHVAYDETVVFQICRILSDYKLNSNTKWQYMQKVLKNFNGDAEGVRIMICNYFNKVLIGQTGVQADYTCERMKYFTDNFYESGKLGLSMACYLATTVNDDTPF